MKIYSWDMNCFTSVVRYLKDVVSYKISAGFDRVWKLSKYCCSCLRQDEIECGWNTRFII